MDELESGIRDLITRSQISHWNPRSGGIIYLGPTGTWSELETTGHQLQARLLEDYRRFASTVRILLREQPGDVLAAFEEADSTVTAIIERDSTYYKTTADAERTVLKALATQRTLLSRLHDRGEAKDIYVPDTNALLYNPDLETWHFDDAPTFEIVLIPTVLAELDRLKVEHRLRAVQEKAGGIIRRIKGYRERGRLSVGVPLVRDKSSIRSIASEPRVKDSLPGLDGSSADDRILASLVEVIRQHPRSAVSLVTRDLNLQNKADFYRLPFVEPPEPSC